MPYEAFCGLVLIGVTWGLTKHHYKRQLQIALKEAEQLCQEREASLHSFYTPLSKQWANGGKVHEAVSAEKEAMEKQYKERIRRAENTIPQRFSPTYSCEFSVQSIDSSGNIIHEEKCRIFTH